MRNADVDQLRPAFADIGSETVSPAHHLDSHRFSIRYLLPVAQRRHYSAASLGPTRLVGYEFSAGQYFELSRRVIG